MNPISLVLLRQMLSHTIELPSSTGCFSSFATGGLTLTLPTMELNSFFSSFMHSSLSCHNVFLGCPCLWYPFRQVCIYWRNILASIKMFSRNLWSAQSATHFTIMTLLLRQWAEREFQSGVHMWTSQITGIEHIENHAMKFFWRKLNFKMEKQSFTLERCIVTIAS